MEIFQNVAHTYIFFLRLYILSCDNRRIFFELGLCKVSRDFRTFTLEEGGGKSVHHSPSKLIAHWCEKPPHLVFSCNISPSLYMSWYVQRWKLGRLKTRGKCKSCKKKILVYVLGGGGNNVERGIQYIWPKRKHFSSML